MCMALLSQDIAVLWNLLPFFKPYALNYNNFIPLWQEWCRKWPSFQLSMSGIESLGDLIVTTHVPHRESTPWFCLTYNTPT